MIGNETEPAIVMEAAEFSLANQTHRQGGDDGRHGNDDDGSSHSSDVKVDSDMSIVEGVVIGERESLLSNEGGVSPVCTIMGRYSFCVTHRVSCNLIWYLVVPYWIR